MSAEALERAYFSRCPKLILSDAKIDSEALISGLGFKTANYLLAYWEIIFERISELS
jgi:hypothetical protein